MTHDEAMDYVLNPDKAPAAGSVEHREFLAFLDQSPEDRRLYDEQAKLFEALDDWQAVEPSAEFDSRLLERIESQRSWYARLFAGATVELLSPGFAVAMAALVLTAGLMVQQRPDGDVALKVAVTDPLGFDVDAEYFDELDRAFDDMEMLADFDALGLDDNRPDRS